MKEYKFKAKIEPTDHGHGFVYFPFDTQEEFGTRGQIRVQATFEGVPYAGALVKYDPPQHMLPLGKNILKQIGKGPGDTVAVVLYRDDSVRTVDVPPEFAKLMKKEGVLGAFEKLSFTHRQGVLPLDHGSEEGRDAPLSHFQSRRHAEGGRKDSWLRPFASVAA
jgi:hypothetical protein